MKKGILFLFFFMISTGLAYGSGAEKRGIKLDKEKLQSGKCQVIMQNLKVEGNGEKKRFVGVMLIDAPPSMVWEVIQDWDAMGDFVPDLEYYKTIHVLKRLDNGFVGESLIEGKFKFIISILYSLHVTFDAPNLRVEWRLLTKEEIESYNKKDIKVKKNSALLKNIEGYGYLEPSDNGSKTIYYYAPTIEISVVRYIPKFLQKSSICKYLEKVKERVESRRIKLYEPRQ